MDPLFQRRRRRAWRGRRRENNIAKYKMASVLFIELDMSWLFSFFGYNF